MYCLGVARVFAKEAGKMTRALEAIVVDVLETLAGVMHRVGKARSASGAARKRKGGGTTGVENAVIY